MLLNMFSTVHYAADCEEGKALYLASRSLASLHKASLSPIGVSPESLTYNHHLQTCPSCAHRNVEQNEVNNAVPHKRTA